MRLLYINDELATGDGSNSHAIGMLRAFQSIIGIENVVSYPKPEDGSGKPVNLGANKLKSKLKAPLAVVRYFRKSILSLKKNKEISKELKTKGFIPTHILARSTNFDTTAIYLAKEFEAKLIYEINTPMFYECGIIKREPMISQIQKWEKKIIKASDYVYVVSKVCRDMLCQHYNISTEKFLIIPNGYMENLYCESDEERAIIRDEIRKAEGLEGKFVVTFVGSLKIWHGIKSFCETAESLSKHKDIVFLVIGDGEMHDMIMTYVNNHSNMVFKGKVNLELMKKLLYASDLGIMPYEMSDNFYYSPLKMYDMIGATLPFIGTSVGQIEEVCRLDLNTNFLNEATSMNSYDNLILSLKSDKHTYEQMRKILQNIRKNYSWYERTKNLIKNTR